MLLSPMPGLTRHDLGAHWSGSGDPPSIRARLLRGLAGQAEPTDTQTPASVPPLGLGCGISHLPKVRTGRRGHPPGPHPKRGGGGSACPARAPSPPRRAQRHGEGLPGHPRKEKGPWETPPKTGEAGRGQTAGAALGWGDEGWGCPGEPGVSRETEGAGRTCGQVEPPDAGAGFQATQ